MARRLEPRVAACSLTEHATTVLVVEPDPSLRSGLVSLLETWGYRASAAADYAGAVAVLSEHDIQLIIQDTDVQAVPGALPLQKPFMPWELKRWIQGRLANTEIH
jgi:PleD family two-component response regulator